MQPWYATSSGRVRLQHDREILRELLPAVKYKVPRGDLVEAEGVVSMMAPKSKIVTDVPTRIVFGKHYPVEGPSAFVLGSMFAPHDMTRHFMVDGSCCLTLLGVDDIWDAQERDALVPWVEQLVLYYHRQLIFDRTGRWPGPARPHGRAAYVQHLLETLLDRELIEAFLRFRSAPTTSFSASLCPCKSQKSFAECHAPLFLKLVTQLRGISDDVLSTALNALPSHSRDHQASSVGRKKKTCRSSSS